VTLGHTLGPALALAVVLAAAGPARADLGQTARDVGEAIGYGVPAIAAAVTTVGNGTALAYGSSMGQGWRIAGWIAGGVEVAIGTVLLLTERDDSFELALGIVPVALGTASIATATFVEREVSVGVVATGRGAAAALRLRW
jgi:hypothetical protein